MRSQLGLVLQERGAEQEDAQQSPATHCSDALQQLPHALQQLATYGITAGRGLIYHTGMTQHELGPTMKMARTAGCFWKQSDVVYRLINYIS